MRREVKKRIARRAAAGMLCAGILLSMPGLRVYAQEDQAQDDGHQIMVSLGDSYSSGEGIEPFYGQEADASVKVQNPDWLAHRSQGSWPGRLTLPGNEGTMADNKGEYWFFAAASGATTENLNHVFGKEYNRWGQEGCYFLEPQLLVFDELSGRKADYVTMTIGGNDVGFSDIITSCVAGSTYLGFSNLYDKLNDTWDEFFAENGTREKLRDAYSAVAEKAGSQAQILIAGYPRLLEENGKGFFISKKEAGYVNSSVSQFNDELEKLVEKCRADGMNISFVSVEEAFAGHGAYSADPYLNEVLFLARDEDLKGFMLASAYSIHPNAAGAQAYASCVQEKIDEIEAQKAAGGTELTDNRLADSDEIAADALHFSGVIVQPGDVVLKMFDAARAGDYEEMVTCLDPTLEAQINFLGNIASSLYGLVTGENASWGQLVLEAAGATNVDVIECRTLSYSMEPESFLSEWLPKIQGARDLFCTDAEVYVKYRYMYNGTYHIEEETVHIMRYGRSGWRIASDNLYPTSG